MQKILFVCLGNICRSPVAEGILLHLKERDHLFIEVDSAGTSNYHVGEAPDTRSIADALKHGVDLSLLRARQFDLKDFDRFDRIFVMDHSNYKHVISLSHNTEHHKKVSLFLENYGINSLREVPDPYYGGEQDFENVFQLLFKACEKFCATGLKS